MPDSASNLVSPPAPPANYIGRFAPSPSGPLHFGSLVSAVASYLDARSQDGRWLLRVEDIDPPREQLGAADIILRQLEQHGLHWDGKVLYQSTRSEAYHEILSTLKNRQLLYPCTCSRQQLAQWGGIHPKPCRDLVNGAADIPEEAHAWRVRAVAAQSGIAVKDVFQGAQGQSIADEVGDFVLLRKDGLFAYQLAVVADEQQQGITHVIRGADLLDSTPRQVYLQQLLGYRSPVYGHVPLAVDAQGNKLSKQNRAPSLDLTEPSHNLVSALGWLGYPVPDSLVGSSPRQLLAWAVDQWDRGRLAGVMARPISSG